MLSFEPLKMKICKVWMFSIIFIISLVISENRIVFPDDETISRNQDESNATYFKIPESILISMKDIHTVNDFIDNFIRPEELESIQHNSILDRSGGSASIDSLPFAESAGCKPIPTLVSLTEENNFSIFYFPTCVYVDRCSGCCASQRMQCSPTQTTMQSFKVLKARYTGSGSTTFKNEGYEILQVEKHEKCSCQCIIKPEHCTDRQMYHECSCSCANGHQAADCPRPLKSWDHDQCRCKCRWERPCSTNLYFNTDTCRCETERNSLIEINSRMRTESTSNETSSNSILFPSD
ncbi:vascular endothelial growth factor A-like [Centruroides sculpturatus]|uniref:vascular endothelial growth factor A-like n=1 Tax=Centruroides sculpturatus TaxID=218467 RepID=UPI000C6EC35A|nr:vascular endothelial growth factor A-like [Centruroides sculpturatus]